MAAMHTTHQCRVSSTIHTRRFPVKREFAQCFPYPSHSVKSDALLANAYESWVAGIKAYLALSKSGKGYYGVNDFRKFCCIKRSTASRYTNIGQIGYMNFL